jgi:hypothetical protein
VRRKVPYYAGLPAEGYTIVFPFLACSRFVRRINIRGIPAQNRKNWKKSARMCKKRHGPLMALMALIAMMGWREI